jgi:chemotaxis protein methyltransferase CheR
MREAAPDALVDGLVALILQETGHRPDAISRDAVIRVTRRVDPSGGTAAAVTRAWADPLVRTALIEAVLVRETSFFRHPEHFDAIVLEAVPLLATKERPVSVWSAGCATGEEAYSLAGCLLWTLPEAAAESLRVLGTDLSDKALAVAQEGVFGERSQRDPSPPFPVFRPMRDGRLRVESGTRAIARFQKHNLLDPPPEGPGAFDLVVCRNVLIYFDDKAAEIACANMVQSLAPGGFALFGILDLPHAPHGLVRVGPPTVNMFLKPPVRMPTERPKTRPPSLRAPHLPAAPGTLDPIAIHLDALEALETGQHGRVDGALARLLAAAPDYVPGIFEMALLHLRAGETANATARMREVLTRIEKLPADAIVAGPEDLPASYYRSAAQASLVRFQAAAGRDGRGKRD